MTNLLATLTIVAITNWTGYIAPSGQEAGIVCKQHTANIVYKGKTNTMVLLAEPTKRAVFKPVIIVPTYNITNLWLTNFVPSYIIYTNYHFDDFLIEMRTNGYGGSLSIDTNKCGSTTNVGWNTRECFEIKKNTNGIYERVPIRDIHRPTGHAENL